MLYLATIGKLLKQFGLPLALIGVVAFVYFHHRNDVRVRNDLVVCKARVVALVAQNDALVKGIGEQNTAISYWQTRSDEFAKRVNELNQRVPEVVTEILTVVETVETEVVSTDCTVAIAEAARVIKESFNEP